MVPDWTNKFRKNYRKKVENAKGTLVRTAPVMRLDERHPWVFRYNSPRFWLMAGGFVAAVVLLSVIVSVLLA
jgi:hypothetical protein